MILDHLKELRAEYPECLTVALFDLSSGLVLCISARDKHPQERLDSLCVLGAELLEGATAKGMSTALAPTKAADPQDWITMTKSETCLFLRSTVDPVEAMFCVCSSDVDVVGLQLSARSCLNKISAEQ